MVLRQLKCQNKFNISRLKFRSLVILELTSKITLNLISTTKMASIQAVNNMLKLKVLKLLHSLI